MPNQHQVTDEQPGTTDHEVGQGVPQASVLRTLTGQRARFLAFVRRRVESRDTAEDILQSSYLRATEHVAELRNAKRAHVWFYRLLRNAVVDHYRRSAVSSKVLAEESLLDHPAGPMRRPNTCPCLSRELAHLKTDYAHALESVEMEDMSVQAFAAHEKVAPGTASVRLHRARKALVARIKIACGSCSGEGCFNCNCA